LRATQDPGLSGRPVTRGAGDPAGTAKSAGTTAWVTGLRFGCHPRSPVGWAAVATRVWIPLQRAAACGCALL